jgi:hypothetical protein
MDEWAQPHIIVNVVANKSTPFMFCEKVLMHPVTIRASDLFVDKPPRRIPNQYFCSPSNRKTMQGQPIVNDGSSGKMNGLGRQDTKTEPRRS